MIAIQVTVDVKDDRRVLLTLPADVPTGNTELLVSVLPQATERKESRDDLRERFQGLVADWKRGRGPHSSSARLADHPAYQSIVDLGPAVIPLLLEELERQSDHWFRALIRLTGADPVPEETRGKVREMAGIWLSWGREHGYRW